MQVSDASLKKVPKDFKIPADFNGVQGVDLPRVFRTTLSRLENRTGLPFVRQTAYEWTENRAAYPDAPYQGDPWHFTRALGDGFSGQFSARAALRAISAYLRTLAVAEQFWDMPSELAEPGCRSDICAIVTWPVASFDVVMLISSVRFFSRTAGIDGAVRRHRSTRVRD